MWLKQNLLIRQTYIFIQKKGKNNLGISFVIEILSDPSRFLVLQMPNILKDVSGDIATGDPFFEKSIIMPKFIISLNDSFFNIFYSCSFL